MPKYPPVELTPDAYELEVKTLLDSAAGGLTEFRSEHREVLGGADGEYEIDVTARFSALGVNFLVLVECKRYTRPVGREKVQALYAKLQSLGAHKAILFSTSGFQSGAVQFADAHGVALASLQDGRTMYFVRSADWDRPLDWTDIPPSIPRIICVMIQENSESVISAARHGDLDAFLGAPTVDA